MGQATARAWALNRISDRQGNFIDFVWAEDTVYGGFRLEEVQYTGSAAISAPYKVDFVYSTRSDIDIEFIAGSQVQELNRLSRIDVTYVGSLIHRYNLSYDVSATSGRDRLIGAQECAGSTPDCLPASVIAYKEGSMGLQPEQSSGITSAAGLQVMDVNGDGKDDFVYSSTATSGTGKWMVAFANASGSFDTPINTNITNTNFAGAVPIDYNADDRADLLVQYSGTTWWVLLGSASGLSAPVNTGTPVTATGNGANARGLDIDGDGRQDLVWAELYGYTGGDIIRYRAALPGSGFSSTAVTLVGPLNAEEKLLGLSFGTIRKPIDFNGDGRADLLYRTAKRFSTTLAAPMATKGLISDESAALGAGEPQEPAVAAAGFTYLYSISAYCPGSPAATYTVGSGNSAAGPPRFGDFNGDGKTDLLYYDSSTTWKYRYSTGVGFTSALIGPSVNTYLDWVVMDWDADGYDDALGVASGGSTWSLLRSSGNAFAAPVATIFSSANALTARAVMDVDGDGLRDLVYGNAAGTLVFRRHTLDAVMPDLLLTVTDAYGTKATFSYMPLTNPAVYTKGTGAVFPMVDVMNERWVVNQLSLTDGSGTTSESAHTFTYEGARQNLQGRGFLGFSKRTVVDGTTGRSVRRIETYSQTFPFIGAMLTGETQQIGGTRISYTTNQWLAVANGASQYPYVSSTSTDEHEVGGTNNGTKVRTMSTVVASAGGIDTASGLIKDATTTTTEVATGIFPASYKSERVLHTVFNDTTNWCIGRPTATQQSNSHTLNFGAAVTRSSDSSWDYVNCRPTQQRLEPGNASLQVTVGIGYDGFGNVNSQTVTGVGMTARTTTTGWGTSGQFPLTVTNALGQTKTQGWNVALGLQDSVTDPNGLTTTWTYDVFGRRTSETRPDLTSTVWTYSACNGGCDARIKMQVLTEERDSSNTTFRIQYDFQDRWGQLVWQQKQLLTSNDQSYFMAREYDASGRVLREYVPYLINTPNNGYHTFAYDVLDRPTSESLYRAGGVFSGTTSFTYNGLVVSQTDSLNHTNTRATSAWGNLIRVTDAASGQVNLQYDAFDLLKQATDPANNTVSQVSYNVRGMRTQLVDMDLGTWNYTPDALGEVVSQTDAKGQTTSFTFDPLGRLTSRTEAEGLTTLAYGTAADNTANNKYIGRLKSVTGPGYAESFTFDAKSRPSTRTITSDTSYQFDYAYNSLGQVDTLTYPTSTAGVRFKAKYGYSGGYLSSVQEFTGNVNGPVLWNLNLLDARLNAVSETYGNGLWLQNGFDALTGEPLTRQSGTGGQTTNVQNLKYVWDTAGNLSNRQDLRQSLTETFTYDALDRLTLASGPGAQSTTIGYDAIGNVTSKTGVGTYTYHATKKHAVVSAGGTSYGYEANGNLISRGGATVTWSSYNMPTYIGDPSGYSAQFYYAPDRSRWKQVSSYAGATETTIYVGGLLEKMTNLVGTHWKHLIPTPSGQVQVVRRSTGTTDNFYVTTDHLGSTDAVLNAAGTVLMRGSFGAHGARRASNWQGVPSTAEWQAIAATTRRGYTGHEQIDNVLLVHMNGRVFDSNIGRFLSADPYIDGPETTQGWNRYAYVHGRALSATDPSGFDDIKEYIFDYDPLRPGCETTMYIACNANVDPNFMDALRRQGYFGQPIGPLFPSNGASTPVSTEPAKSVPVETEPSSPQEDPRCKKALPDGSTVAKNVRSITDRAMAQATNPRSSDAAIFQTYGYWFWQVREGGDWDYKRQPGGTEEIGNFNYGATGAVLFSSDILLRAAGAVQLITLPSASEGSNPFGSPPYGDQVQDQKDIAGGISASCQ